MHCLRCAFLSHFHEFFTFWVFLLQTLKNFQKLLGQIVGQIRPCLKLTFSRSDFYTYITSYAENLSFVMEVNIYVYDPVT